MEPGVLWNWAQWAWIGVGALTFVLLCFVTAPYGRHTRGGWGPLIEARLGWIIMEAASPLFLAIAYFGGLRSFNPVTLLFVLLWLGHYANRSLLYPLRMKNGSRPMPFSMVAAAVLFNLVNGLLNGRYLALFGDRYTAAWLADPRFLFGAALFFTGMIINLRSDATLRRLREDDEPGYKIPRGGMFELVSCANYFGEVLEWIGWAVLTWSLPGFTFALWTVANLVPRARAHHEWYRRNFPDYPAHRKAIIPYIL
jgi:protein-S-isoprenylcysteine O-methyltransferase Ste14